MTIYALSSGAGISGVAVIRISGEKTKDIIKQITGRELPKPRIASLNKIREIKTNELIDEGIIIWFPGPDSYTGEDMAELHVHGSSAVIKSILDNISKINNCRLAEAGEFTKIAFQNEKINLLKAESIGDLIAAETDIQRRQALKIMGGKSGNQGYMMMTDEWFDEYTYEVVIDKKYLNKRLLKYLDMEPIALAPWDPMGALAR